MNDEQIKIADLSDDELFKKCQEYGQNAKVWIRKFAALLPEVERRQLYRKKGFLSLFEFAKKLAGMSEYTVERILLLAKRLENKPALKNLFESGTQGWSKIEKVSFVATPDTEKDWAEKVEKMSVQTLGAYIHQKRLIDNESNLDCGTVDVDDSQSNLEIRQQLKYLSFHVTPNIEFKLRLYKQHLEKSQKQSLTWNEVFAELLKENMQENFSSGTTENLNSSVIHRTFSRHIPQKIRNFILSRYGHKCAFPGCNKPSDIIHHLKRFSLSHSHDPKDLLPLCDLHHNLVHTGFIENEEDPPEKWKIKENPQINSLSTLIDQKILNFKNSI